MKATQTLIMHTFSSPRPEKGDVSPTQKAEERACYEERGDSFGIQKTILGIHVALFRMPTKNNILFAAFRPQSGANEPGVTLLVGAGAP